MPATSLLVVGNRLALQPGGSRIVLADASCCCGGCPLWRKLLQCPNSPVCVGEPPPQREIWICDTVVCETTGEPIFHPLGRTVFIDGLCWSVTADTLPVPPPGADVVGDNDPVECIGLSACADPRCPQGELFLLGRPCNPANEPVYFCGVTECGIYRSVQGTCQLVDPATGYVPAPPGAPTSPNTGRFLDCCECEPGCAFCPMVDGQVDNPECFPGIDFTRSCCRSLNACYRVDRIFGRQTFNPPAPAAEGGVLHSITNEVVAFILEPGGIQTANMRNVRRIDFLDGNGPQDIVSFYNTGLIGACGFCPRFRVFPAERQFAERDFTGFLPVALCGQQPPGTVLHEFTYRLSCDEQTYILDFTADVGRLISTRVEIEAHIEETDGTCAGRCLGRGVSHDRRALTGCTDCGKGNRTERVR